MVKSEIEVPVVEVDLTRDERAAKLFYKMKPEILSGMYTINDFTKLNAKGTIDEPTHQGLDFIFKRC